MIGTTITTVMGLATTSTITHATIHATIHATVRATTVAILALTVAAPMTDMTDMIDMTMTRRGKLYQPRRRLRLHHYHRLRRRHFRSQFLLRHALKGSGPTR